MMPRKQWGTFEKVNAADVNGFLADQSVMTFATTAARDAALPTPTTGMQSAVQASPDLGAPRYWDGSAWTLVRNGAAVPAVTSQLNATTLRRVIPNTWTSTSNAWQEVTSGLGSDALVYGIRHQVNQTSGSGHNDFQLGTGASGSEVVRFADYIDSSTVVTDTFSLVQPGVFVPSGTRIAIRYNVTAGFAQAAKPSLIVSTGISGAQWQADIYPSWATSRATVSGVAAGAWGQVDTAPPLAGGCWVTGVKFESIGGVGWSFGLGNSGSEVAVSSLLGDVSGSLTGITGTSAMSYLALPIAPFFWPASTRLAIRNEGSTTQTAQFKLVWRESLA